jgi:Ca2+-binding EF-hand superfamily protein
MVALYPCVGTEIASESGDVRDEPILGSVSVCKATWTADSVHQVNRRIEKQQQEDHFMQGRQISKVAVGAGLLSMALACGARAGDKDSPGPIHSIEDLQDVGKLLFKLADTNNDNLISQKEAVDAGNLLAGGFFFRADANGDGVVSRDEARSAREALFNQKPLLRFVFQRGESAIKEEGGDYAANQRNTKLLDVLDTNHDGNFSASELRQAVQTSVQTLFLTADRNGDGQLDPAEVNQAVIELGRTAVQTAFNAADTDKNGAVSEAEFDKAIVNPAHVMFKIFDANNDGQISADEMRSGMQILVRELRSMRIPEQPNSLSHQIQNLNNAQSTGDPRVIAPRPTAVQIVPGVAPTQPVPPRQ